MKILFTLFCFREYTGSEIVVRELIEEFRKLNYEMYVAAFFVSKEFIDEYKDVTIIDLVREKIPAVKFDVIWAHHIEALNYATFQNSIAAGKIIYSCLSPYDPMESIPIYYNELDLILVNSVETMIKAREETNNFDRIRLFENSITERFLSDNAASGRPATLSKIAVISNHVPEEVASLGKLFARDKIVFDIYGKNHKYVIVTPELLNDYDLIITIGKTVQYCFGLKRPVYVYDRYGGPGYLNADNFESARKNNFSGRGAAKKSAEGLYADIKAGYAASTSFFEFLHAYAAENYLLSKNIKSVLAALDETGNDSDRIAAIKNNYKILERCSLNYYNLLVQNTRLSSFVDDYIKFRNKMDKFIPWHIHSKLSKKFEATKDFALDKSDKR